jgi:hypothetical protein
LTGSYEHGDEFLGSVEDGGVLDLLEVTEIHPMD